jgi:hypothetical protein
MFKKNVKLKKIFLNILNFFKANSSYSFQFISHLCQLSKNELKFRKILKNFYLIHFLHLTSL